MSENLYRGPDGAALRFYTEPGRNNYQSEQHGKPLFDTVTYVEVITPGSNESKPVFEIERVFCPEAGQDANGQRLVQRGEKYERYREAFDKFRSDTTYENDAGLPITQWPQIDAGMAATLKAAGVHTVEMLARVSDSNIQNIGMGGAALREQAKAYLLTREGGAPVAQQAAETENLRRELARVTRERDEAIARLAPGNAPPATQFSELQGATTQQAQDASPAFDMQAFNALGQNHNIPGGDPLGQERYQDASVRDGTQLPADPIQGAQNNAPPEQGEQKPAKQPLI